MRRNLIALPLIAFLVLSLIAGCSKKSTEPDPDPIPIVDLVDPMLQIDKPTAMDAWVTLEQSVAISGSASDDKKLKSISYSVDGGDAITATGLASWQTSSIPLSNGDHTIIVTAYDEVGNSASDTIIITKNPYLDFIGQPFTNPTGVFVNQPNAVVFRISLGYNANLIPSSVQLVTLDESNNIIDTLTPLYDNGDLAEADEIANDGVFSASVEFDESTVTTMKFRAEAYSSEGNEPNYSMVFSFEVFPELDDADVQTVIDVQTSAETFLNDSTSGLTLNQAATKLAGWLQNLSSVVEATVVGGDIEVKYSSGLEGGILLAEMNASGNVTTKGGAQNFKREAKAIVPLSSQTVGKTSTSFTPLEAYADEDIILDKDVLIWAPFESYFSPDMGPSLVTIFNNSELGLNVVSVSNQQCTIASLNNLTGYGLVIFDTHGYDGKEILTGEIVTPANRITYALLLKEVKIKIWTNIVYDVVTNGFNKTADFYSICSPFISALAGTFPNSVIFNGSCESTKNPDLSNAFINKGAKTYFGFNLVVNTTFCRDMADDIFEALTVDMETTGQAFTAGQTDPVSPNATFEMNGSDKMHFSLSLINGNFETGDLTAWTKDGDGRVITQLGNLIPPQQSFMGIISTGLGFTTSTGSIAQSFKVDASQTSLSLDWNFISEEFDEWVGSQYQDYFIIEVIHDGITTELFNKAIDQFWYGYSMVYVSPTIVFDQGDVWMTGWQTSTFDLSAYSGETIRLVLRVGDIGDSIYDSAVLLDKIAMN